MISGNYLTNYRNTGIPNKVLNLNKKSEFKELLEIIENTSGWMNLTIEEIEESIEFIKKKLPLSGNLNVKLTDYPIIGYINICNSDEEYDFLEIGELILLGYRLKELSYCEGFEYLLKRFYDPSQFMDAVFETEAAFFCLKRPKTSSLCFSPGPAADNQKLSSSFQYESNGSKINCECKSLLAREFLNQKEFGRVYELFAEEFSQLDIPGELRVDVHFWFTSDCDYSELSKEASNAVEILLKTGALASINIGDLEIDIKKRNDPPNPQNMVSAINIMVETDLVTTITTWNCPFTISTDMCDEILHENVRKFIKETTRKLPESDNYAIFIKTGNMDIAKRAVDERIIDPLCNRVLSYGIFGKKRSFHYKRKDLAMVESFFGPF